MSSSFSFTEAQTFTITHARHMAAKVATDLKRLQRFYGEPSDAHINGYEIEVIELLKDGYLREVTYGFKHGGEWIEPCLRYSARNLSDISRVDDDPGRIRPGANIEGANFYSYLTYTAAWDELSSDERTAVRERLPVDRAGAAEPAISGYLHNDRTYSSGGRALYRATVRSY